MKGLTLDQDVRKWVYRTVRDIIRAFVSIPILATVSVDAIFKGPEAL